MESQLFFIVVVLSTMLNVIASSHQQRPEITLLDLLAKPFAPTEGASHECLRDSKIYLAELSNYNPWALQMYDASAKIPAGVITGNIQQLGNYDECLKVKTGQQFSAQACSASVQFEILNGSRSSVELDMKDLFIQVAKASNVRNTPSRSEVYEWLWCVPSTCNHSEISEALELALNPLKVDGRLDIVVNVDAHSCRTSSTDAIVFDVGDWFFTVILLIFLALVVASTVYDLRAKRATKETESQEFKRSLLTSFSLYTNGKSIFNTNRRKDAIGCIDGLRFISTCWVLSVHSMYLTILGVQMDRTYISKLHENWGSMFYLNGSIVTDILFLLSGILLAYTILIKNSKEVRPRLNVPSLYLNRYLRLTPAYGIVVGFYATLFEKIGSGPRWRYWIHSGRLNCRAHWWKNMLYINNHVDAAKMCIQHTWYLSAEMQLIWLSPIFLYPMIKYNKSIIFWIVTGIGAVASVFIPFFITYFQHLGGTLIYYKGDDLYTNVYFKSYMTFYARTGSFIIGIALGYILFKTKGYKIRIPSIYVFCGWLIAIIAGMSAVLGPRGMYFDDHPYNRLEASFYAGLHRHAFALAVSWIIFACVNGYAGPLNTFLSWRGWIPLSRLSYCAFLTHAIPELCTVGIVRTPFNMTVYTEAIVELGTICLTMLISLCLCCCIELPFMVLKRLLLTRKPQKDNREGLTATDGIYRPINFKLTKDGHLSDVKTNDVIAPLKDEQHCPCTLTIHNCDD